MNPFKKMIPAILLLIFIQLGCSKDSDLPDFLKCKIDGVPFACSSGFRASSKDARSSALFFEAAAPGYFFKFFIDEQGTDIKTGTYVFEYGKIRSATFYENNNGYSSGYYKCLFGPCILYGSGKITITSINKKHVEGTFEFITAVDGSTNTFKTVTDGEFNINRH